MGRKSVPAKLDFFVRVKYREAERRLVRLTPYQLPDGNIELEFPINFNELIGIKKKVFSHVEYGFF